MVTRMILHTTRNFVGKLEVATTLTVMFKTRVVAQAVVGCSSRDSVLLGWVYGTHGTLA